MLPKPKEISSHHSLHLMRENIVPLWEDSANKNGGIWKMKVHKNFTEKIWIELLMAAIDEQFSDCLAPGDEISGVTINIKEREDLVQLWNKNANLANKGKVIEKVKELIPGITFIKCFYKGLHMHRRMGELAVAITGPDVDRHGNMS
ncbi:hypothetical protein LAZ67_X004090 [Cordylochernes scorpioides]|uniref:Eukaryotic translation initiation factor 4E type 3 n=1 Tax=Cordylochernes scorpioides TaxID=51811 RepID=A0ABY6LVN4_9ARAC|nr:hypothetical protein LAZ67_X004090 [Cordylochernes scorpioides]